MQDYVSKNDKDRQLEEVQCLCMNLDHDEQISYLNEFSKITLFICSTSLEFD